MQHDHPHQHIHQPTDSEALVDPRPPRQEQADAITDVTEIAPGVVRTQLPISMPGPGHVNCSVLEDERGIAVVDPGLPGDDSWNHLVDRLGRAAHGHPFTDLGGRAEHITEHHEERLDIIRTASHDLPNGTVDDFMRVLFKERSWGEMAENETYAHLEHLCELGQMSRHADAGFARCAPAGQGRELRVERVGLSRPRAALSGKMSASHRLPAEVRSPCRSPSPTTTVRSPRR